MRPLAAALLLVLALGLAACGGDDDGGAAGGGDATAAETPAPTPSPTPSPTAAPPEAEPAEQPVLWPDPAGGGPSEPLDVARSFVADFVGLEDPALGDVRTLDTGTAEIDVFRRGEGGSRLEAVVATLALTRGDGDRWFVAAATSPEVEIETPAPGTEAASPLTISGRGRGFEGNVVLQVRAAHATEALAEEPVTAGSMGDLEPFEATLEFEAPRTAGAVVALTGSGIAAADGFAAFPVTF